MAEVSADRFAEFFEALWQRPPFAWQRELAARVLDRNDSPWPRAIDLPTASGKTACIDIAVFALAASLLQQESTVRCTAPRRIFFVVDRRIIVDEAADRARKIACKLMDAGSGILKEIADALRRIAHGHAAGWHAETPLLTFELRGGMYRSEAWARSPLQPVVVSSTVDQLGSRLLFRAYGRGPGTWPILAGLVANDSLILLDEAHCARPFLETLQAVATYRRLAQEPLSIPFHPIVLSATRPANIPDYEVFRDTSPEPVDPRHPLGRRQLAHKPALLVEPIPGKVAKGSSDRFASALADKALELARAELKAVVIFANRVATARAAHRILRSQGHDAILLTGRMRPFDKDDIAQDRLRLLSAKESDTRDLERPLFVVATQTLEVGADLDFDALVTECASLDALRQRFGRLNRMGRRISARAAILIRREQSEDSAEDPVYGGALARTWTWMKTHAGAAGELDFGIAYFNPWLPHGEELEALTAPFLNPPVLLPAHLDCLAQTSPIPRPSPDVTLFLHGSKRLSADVHVCWREDITLTDSNADDVLEAVAQCPPSSAECLPVPIWRFRAWMTGDTAADTSADVEGERPPENESNETSPKHVIRWRSRAEAEARVVDDPAEIYPGDVIVIPADQIDGWDTLGDLARDEESIPVLDWGDRAYCSIRARALLRLHPELIKRWPKALVSDALKKELIEFAERDAERFQDDPDTVLAELQALLGELLTEVDGHDIPRPWRWLPAVIRALARDPKLVHNVVPHPFRGLILRGSRRMVTRADGSDRSDQPDVFTDEDDRSASGTVPVPLAEHLPGVASFARRFADGCGLSPSVARAVELAARLHDLGKADPRFQALLHGGQRFAIGDLLAKSAGLPKGRNAYEHTRQVAGYPEGGRHELLSVRLTEGAEDWLPEDSTLRDLVLHLIASHHGYCRPFAPVVFDEQPINVSFELFGRSWSHEGETHLERLDSGISARFWRLVRRHGWWGLAWLEALLRLADHRRSEAEQNEWEERHA